VQDLRSGVAVPQIAARFHSGVAKMVQETCRALSREHKVRKIALSGGVWQNSYLLALTVGLLQEDQFEVILHRQLPANDGGISLGQAVTAIARSRNQ
jgi:hydrogenase maturation protein HypF